jgi:hypothetical protein
MLPRIQQVLNDAAGRFATIRADVTIADAAMLGNSGSSRICATTRATAYVWTSATLEAFVKSSLSAVLAEINGAAVPRQRLKLCLHSLVTHSSFAALQSVRGLNMWDERVRALEDIDSGVVAPFNTTVLPLDGRTLRHQHFDAIWRVFGFRPPSLPKPVCSFALTDLAEGRNELAHGHTSAEDFVRTKTTAHVLRVLSLVEDVAEHLSIAADAYLANKEYLR